METWDLPGVAVFQSGLRRGKQWTEADIDAMVANYSRLADRHAPPIVIGHGDEIDLGTGAPSLGKVANPRKEVREVDGQNVPTLVVDFVNMPPAVADLISAGIYDRLSPEIAVQPEVYDETPEGCEKAEGPILRRVALLGGELPQIKTLGDLAALMKERGQPSKQAYSERLAARPRLALRPVRESLGKDGRLVAVFSEFQREEKIVTKMKPAAEWSDATKAIVKKFAEMPAGETGGVTRDDLLAMLADMNLDSSLAEGASDAFLMEVVRGLSMSAEQGADGARDAMDEAEEKPIGETPVETPAAETPAEVPAEEEEEEEETVAMSEIEALKAKLAATEKLARDTAMQARNERTEAFCEKLFSEHRISPAVKPLLANALKLVDAETVHKFGEGESTALDAVKQALSHLPVYPMGEKIPGANQMDDELAAVVAFSEKPANKTILLKSGRPANFLVETFKQVREKDPTMTAQKFLGSPAA